MPRKVQRYPKKLRNRRSTRSRDHLIDMARSEKIEQRPIGPVATIRTRWRMSVKVRDSIQLMENLISLIGRDYSHRIHATGTTLTWVFNDCDIAQGVLALVWNHEAVRDVNFRPVF